MIQVRGVMWGGKVGFGGSVVVVVVGTGVIVKDAGETWSFEGVEGSRGIRDGNEECSDSRKSCGGGSEKMRRWSGDWRLPRETPWFWILERCRLCTFSFTLLMYCTYLINNRDAHNRYRSWWYSGRSEWRSVISERSGIISIMYQSTQYYEVAI